LPQKRSEAAVIHEANYLPISDLISFLRPLFNMVIQLRYIWGVEYHR